MRRKSSKIFVWTSELAYAIGLLVTDGNLSGDGRHFSLRSAETEQLETFRCCLGLKQIIGRSVKPDGHVAYRVQVGDIQFYDWLMSIGLFPNKSYTIGPIAVPDEFFRDYLRGCIDGDGNIQTYNDNYNSYKGHRYSTQRLFIRIVSASEKHILWLQDTINRLIGVRGFISKREHDNENYVPLWELKFAKKKSLQLIECMYYSPDVPCLQRKRKIAEEAIAIISTQKRKRYPRL